MKIKNPKDLFIADYLDAVADMVSDQCKNGSVIMGGIYLKVGSDVNKTKQRLHKQAKSFRDNAKMVEEIWHDRVVKK